MHQVLKEPISVISTYSHKSKKTLPIKVVWQERDYKITKLGLHYVYRTGDTLYHVFTVTTAELSLKLLFDTSNLFWTLEEISDGLP